MISISFSQWLTVTASFYISGLLFFLLKREKVASALLLGGLIANTALLFCRGWHYGILIYNNMVAEIYFIPWCLALLSLGLRMRKKYAGASLGLLLPVCIFMVIALLYPAVMIPPGPEQNVIFSTLFFLFEVFAHACFFVAGWFGLLFVLNRSSEPLFNNFAVWGFVLYSIAQIVGAVWCYLGWGAPFNWSERHLMSAALWCFYCAYLHLGFSLRWNMRQKSWFAFAGFWVTFAVAYNFFVYYLGGQGA